MVSASLQDRRISGGVSLVSISLVESGMKRIEAVIPPAALNSFKEAAFRLGISEFELVEVYRLGCETVDGGNGLYRGGEYRTELSPRLRVEFVMFDDQVQKTLHGLLQDVHPESISIFRLDQEVRTIQPAHSDAKTSITSAENIIKRKAPIRCIDLKPEAQ
jgi:nitrogen regulatory protein PII